MFDFDNFFVLIKEFNVERFSCQQTSSVTSQKKDSDERLIPRNIYQLLLCIIHFFFHSLDLSHPIKSTPPTIKQSLTPTTAMSRTKKNSPNSAPPVLSSLSKMKKAKTNDETSRVVPSNVELTNSDVTQFFVIVQCTIIEMFHIPCAFSIKQVHQYYKCLYDL